MIFILGHIIVAGGVHVSYIIQYTPEADRRYPHRNKPHKVRWGSILLILSVAASAIWIRMNGVPDAVIPGDPVVTKAAAVEMVERIKRGDSLNEVVTVFCKEILDGAQIENIR